MKLIRCHIENFGKLSDFTYEFTEGCNTVCEENGWGKSTLAAFLRVMLFGFRNEGKRDPIENERRRYTPWQKGVYGGELQFESDGKQYSVRRTFGNKAAEDEFRLTDLTTHLPSDDFTEKLGEELFQIDAVSFERTTFISQNDCETFVTDSINAKIGNLAENTDDINNFETADKRLNDLLNSMSPSRKTGSIRRDKDRITELKTQIRNGQEIQNTMESIAARRKTVIEEREKLASELAELQAKQRELGAYKDRQARKEKYLDLRAKLAERERLLKEAESYFNGVIPSETDLREETAAYNRGISIHKAMEIYCLTEEEQEQLKTPFPKVDREQLEEKYAEAEELERLKNSSKDIALSAEETRRLQELTGYFADGMPQEQEIFRAKEIWTGRLEKKSLLQAKEIQKKTLEAIQAQEESRLQRERMTGKKRRNLMLVLGILLILGAVPVIFMGQTVIGAALAALGAVVVIIALVMAAGSGNMQSSENTELLELRQELEKLETEIDTDSRQIEEFRQRWGIPGSSDFTSEIVELQNKRRDYEMLSRRRQQAGTDTTAARMEELETCLKQFLAGFSDVWEEQNYLAALHDIAAKSRQRQLLEEKQKQYRRQREQYEALKEKVKKYLLSLHLIPEEPLEEQLTELENRRKDYEKELLEYRRSAQELKQFEEQEDVPALLALKAPEGEESLESLAEEMKVLSERMEDRYKSIRSYQDQLSSLQESWENIENMEGELENLQETTEEKLKQYRLLEVTKGLLEEAKSSFTAKYTEPVMVGFRKYYQILTGTECENYQMDANTKLQVIDGNMPRDIGYMSLGNRDLIGICMRMALVEAMYDERKPFLILDDPFVNLDENRTRGAIRFLSEIAKEYQVIYFTCHSSRE